MVVFLALVQVDLDPVEQPVDQVLEQVLDHDCP